MRKPYRILAVLFPLLLTACTAAPAESQTETEPPTETTAPTEEHTTEPITPETEPAPTTPAVPYTGETHVFDLCGVLDSAALTKYDEYLDDLADSRLICTAAVITDSLDGASPEAFARAYYRNLYGTESGFLVLINNDTGQDVIYREGACETYITETALPLAQATPHLVEGDYAGALDILLSVGEAMPEEVFDRTGKLSETMLAAIIERAQADPEKNCVLLTDAVPEPEEDETFEQVLAAYAEEIRSRLEADTLLVLDVTSGLSAIAGSAPESLAAEVQEIREQENFYAAIMHYYAGLHPAETTEAGETE